MKDCPLVTELMKEVRAKMDKENLSIQDLATAIGKPENYNQVYAWVVEERQHPRAEIGLRLQAWAHDQWHRLKRSIKNSQ